MVLFLITCFVLVFSVPAVLYGNFHNRITAWEQTREAGREYREEERDSRGEEESSREDEKDSRENDENDFRNREHEGDSKEREENDLKEIHRYFHLSWGDLAIFAGCAMAGTAMGIWYWILVIIWAYRKAYRLGINGRLAALAALFFNLAAVMVLYLYGILKGTCKNCGRVRSGDGNFCDRCGNPLKKECPNCGKEVDALSAYCSNCGKKLDEKGETVK